MKPKNNSLLRKKNTKGVILEQKEQGRLRMAKIVGNDDFEKFSQFFSKYTNGDVALNKTNITIPQYHETNKKP